MAECHVLQKRREKIKVRTTQAKAQEILLLPICVESVNMLEGLMEEEAEQYFADHTNIIPLYEINIANLAEPYQREVLQD